MRALGKELPKANFPSSERSVINDQTPKAVPKGKNKHDMAEPTITKVLFFNFSRNKPVKKYRRAKAIAITAKNK